MPRWLRITLVLLSILLFGIAGLIAGYFYRDYQFKKTTLSGEIKISSTPTGAKIFLDGKNVGKLTPATLKKIKPGKHTIKLAKQGFLEWEAMIEVLGGEKNLVEAKLVKKAALEGKLEGGREREKKKAPLPPDNTPPPTPTQLSPPNGQAYPDSPEEIQTTLQWTEVTDPSGVTYSVELEYFQFTQWHPWRTITGLTSPSYTWTLKYETQRWRVWAIDGAGNQSEKSPWWKAHIFPD